jgi:hypothetical protein
VGVAIQGGIVPVYDLTGSPRITAGREARGATREVELAWVNIDALIAELFPAAPSLPGAYPGVSYLYAENVDISPLHPDGDQTCAGDVATYGRARATISYSRLPYEPDATQLISRRYSMGGEFMTIPSGTLYWDEAGFFVPIQEEEIAANKTIPTIEHSITWHRVPEASIPWTAIKDKVGKVNSGSLNNDYFKSVAAETLLYVGAELSFTLSTDGTKVWTLEHRFQEKNIKEAGNTHGWNYFLRPSDSAWLKMVDVDGNPVYPTSGSFDDLFA